MRTPIGNSILNDPDNPRIQALFLYQAGLGMPSRDYYLGEEPRLQNTRAAYLAHADLMLELAGDKHSAEHARALLALETEIARVQWTSADSYDPAKTNNRMNMAQLAPLAPGLDWKSYLAGAGITGDLDTLIIQHPSFFSGLGRLVNSTPLETWKIYFRYQLLSAYAPYLSRAFVDEGICLREHGECAEFHATSRAGAARWIWLKTRWAKAWAGYTSRSIFLRKPRRASRRW